VSERSSRRRLRLRRKRKDESFGSRLSDPGQISNRDGSAPSFDINAGDAVEIVGHLGCCVVEALGSAAVLLALLSVPAYLLLTRVT
jgi:hypothetical protein